MNLSAPHKNCFKVNCKKLLQKRLPITQWLPKYKLSFLLQDILAGFTVSLTQIPQAIAYAGVAGLPPEYGLYSSFMGGFAYAVLGTCKDVNIGPISTVAQMVQPHTANLGPDVAVLTSFLAGFIACLLAIFNLGFVIEFFSYPVIAGFACAASVQVSSAQINNLFGIPAKSKTFLGSWQQFFEKIGEISKWDTVLGIFSLLFLIAFREIKRFETTTFRPNWSRMRNSFGIFIFGLSIARNATIVIIGTVIAYSYRESAPLRTTGSIKGGFPPFEPPPFTTTFNGTTYTFAQMAKQLDASIFLIPLVTIVQIVSIVKTFSAGKPVDATQEILTLGIGNMFSSFVHSMPISGSFSRSAINKASGVKTPLGGIFTSIVVFLAIAFLTPTFYYVPKATLAAVIISAMVHLFDYQAFVLFWKNKKLDLLPLLSTFLGGLFISLEYGILIGIAVNLLFVLYPSARPELTITNEKISNHRNDVYVLTPKDTVYFPAAGYLRDTVLGCEGDNVIVVINGKHIRHIDITIVKSLVAINRKMGKNKFILWHFRRSVIQVCVGVDDSLRKCFKTGELDDILRNQTCEDDSCEEAV